MQENVLPKLPGKRKLILIISTSIVLLALLSTAVYLAVSARTPRELYLELESRNFKKYVNDISHIYKDFFDSQQPYMSGKYSNRTELTANIKSETKTPFNIENAGGIFEVINRSKLITNINNDADTGESVAGYSLLMDRSPFLDGQIISSGSRLSISIPVLLPDRYLSINKQGLDVLYDRLKIPVKPKRLVRAADIARDIYFNEKELDTTAGEYGKLISGFIEDGDVKPGDRIALKVGDKEVEGREITVNLSREKTGELFKSIADKAADDGTLFKLTYSNYAGMVKMLKDIGFFQAMDTLDRTGYLQLNDVLNGFIGSLETGGNEEKFKDKIKKCADNMEFPEGLKMKLVTDKADRILSRQVDFAIVYKNSGERYSLSIRSGTNSLQYDDLKNRFFSIQLAGSGSGGDPEAQLLSVDSAITPLSGDYDEKGNVKIEYWKKRNSVKQFGIKAGFDIDKNTDRTALRENGRVGYDIRFTGEGDSVTDTFKGTVNTSAWENRKFKTRNKTLELVVNFDMPSMDIKDTAVSVKTVTEDKFGIDFTIPQIPESSTVRLDNISDSDFGKLHQDIMASFGRFYLENRIIIDALFN